MLHAQRPLTLPSIAESGKTLHRLLTDALDLSRVEAGAMKLDPAPVDLGELVAEIADLWRPQAELKELDLIVDAVLADCTVMVDAVRLKQVLNNLVGNALKFTERGGVTLRFKLAPDDDGQACLGVEVEDSGVGIAADKIDRIFAPFAKADEHAGGAGLGLAICREIVAAMGGAMAARSTPGIGSVFSFNLVLPTACRVELAPPVPQGDVGGTAHILVIDDNETNRLIACTLLDMFGFTHAVAVNGLDATERAHIEAFDLILMDIKMPVMGGKEATAAIHNRPGPNRETPIVAVTANADPLDIATYRAAGMVGVVEKPLQAERLIAAIVEALDGRSAPSAALCA